MDIFSDFANNFYLNFIKDNRWRYLTDGLAVTIEITFFAVIIGIVIGFLIALVRTTHDTTGRLKFLNAIARLYLTIIRGTPIVLQLLIVYFFIFYSVNVDKVVAAVLAFGLNSAAYVAEIFRSGIMSIERGQLEAGRSLGLPYRTTMAHIIMPQALKNVLPSLFNEFIALLKETAICGYIALQDLTRGGDIIRSRTFNILPLLAVALIYLTIVLIIQFFIGKLEGRLRKSDSH